MMALTHGWGLIGRQARKTDGLQPNQAAVNMAGPIESNTAKISTPIRKAAQAFATVSPSALCQIFLTSLIRSDFGRSSTVRALGNWFSFLITNWRN